ncbi:hypothetical protein BDV11DRAFT_216152 [Aspergillus similis]
MRFLVLITATLAQAATLDKSGDDCAPRKRGAAYNDASLVSVLTSTNSVSWAYNWALTSDGNLPGDVEFVPMVWDDAFLGEESFSQAIAAAVGTGSTHLLGFNEPDVVGQANMTASHAALQYRTYLTPFQTQLKLVSPAVTNSVLDSEGLGWMRSFLQLCEECAIGALAVHWYGDSVADFRNYVNQAQELAAQHGIPEIWITEFALASPIDEEMSINFLSDILPWLDLQCGVQRYAYFMVEEGRLINDDQLSPIGKTYVS